MLSNSQFSARSQSLQSLPITEQLNALHAFSKKLPPEPAAPAPEPEPEKKMEKFVTTQRRLLLVEEGIAYRNPSTTQILTVNYKIVL